MRTRDLAPGKTVYTAGSLARARSVHLSPDCKSLANASPRAREVSTCHGDEKVCGHCLSAAGRGTEPDHSGTGYPAALEDSDPRLPWDVE